MNSTRIAFAALAAMLAGGAAHAATFTVSTTADTGAGSLRSAIALSNITVVGDAIEFNIPGPGPHVIALQTPLPTIAQPLTIDGYTQPGAAPNTLLDGGNAVIKIRLDGTALGNGTTARALSICASNTTIRGLSFTNFASLDVAVGLDNTPASCAAAISGAAIQGNYFGFLPDGRTLAGAGDMIIGANGQGTIGGPTPQQRNVFGGANQSINLSSAGNSVQGNYLGTDANGRGNFGGLGAGIFVTGAADNSDIGGTVPNLIADFDQAGVLVAGTATGVTTGANRFVRNTIAIDLAATGNTPDGVTPNDPNDTDTGANNLQNFPESIAVTRTATGLTIAGRVDRQATATSLAFTIGVYANANCSAANARNAERFLGTFGFTSTNQGVENFNVAFPTTEALPIGTGIVLTATAPDGSTSELSDCVVLDAGNPTFTVNKTADTNDGACNTDCSLREAIVAANAQADANIIAFNLPGTGAQTIALTSNLPTITSPVLIDGYTQPGASPNTSTTSSNATIRVRLQGTAVPTPAFGFAICGNDVWVRGLSITNFLTFAVIPGRQATDVGCSPAPRNTRITGNFLGLAPDGVTTAANGTGVRTNSGSDHVVGGLLPAERNVISGNNNGVTLNGSTRALVIGNLIGTSAAGTLARGNVTAGVFLLSGVICQGVGVGDDAAPNLIAFNGIGVNDNSGSDCPLSANDFQANGALAIDLDSDGLTPNDTNDADTGPNGLQNFPVLTRAATLGGVLTLTGSLDVPAAQAGTYRFALYESAACDASGNGEGEIYLGYADAFITGTAEGFSVQLPATTAVGRTLTATATDPTGNTSELSACTTVVDGDILLSNGFE